MSKINLFLGGGASYYPNCAHKSLLRIAMEQTYIWLRYGAPERFYILYGFDRKEMSLRKIEEQYLLPNRNFQKRISSLNSKQGKLNGKTITGDKFYFYIFLNHFGIPTPKVNLYIKDESPIYISESFQVDTAASPKEQLRQFFSRDMDAFAKPVAGQMGKGAFKLDVKNGTIYVDEEEKSFDELMQIINHGNYLVQECVYQHPIMNKLNPSCINSVRLQTVIDRNGEVHPFGAGLRIGRSGSSVDNWAKGGIFVGIDMKTGKLMERGFLKPQYGTIVTSHPDTHVVFKDFEIPFFHEAVDEAMRLHKYLYRCHSVGWDIAITEKGPVIIEGNSLWEISLVQAVHGGLKKEVGEYFC